MNSHRYLILTAQEIQTVNLNQLVAPPRYSVDNSLGLIEYAISIDESLNITRPLSINPSWYIKELMPPEASALTRGPVWEPELPETVYEQ
jgi:hypothetical protein